MDDPIMYIGKDRGEGKIEKLEFQLKQISNEATPNDEIPPCRRNLSQAKRI